MREKGLVVDGFLFSTNKEFNDAKQELEAIEYFRTNSDLTKPRTVLRLYNKLTENQTFHTPIGYAFLKELQNNVLKAGIVKMDELAGIYIPIQNGSEDEEFNSLSLNHYKQLAEKSKLKNRNSRIINVSMLIIIIVMIVIALYSDKTLYSDFENNIIDKYSSWEEDLNNREEDLDYREQLLKDLESNVNADVTITD